MSRRIAVTCGEPAGIGPDLCITLVQQQQQELLFIGDPRQLTERARQLRLPLTLNLLDSADASLAGQAGVMDLLPVQFPEVVSAGRLAPKNSAVVLQSIDLAVAGCLNGEFSAMVTCPVHKGVINDAGFPFSGHTEYIAAKSGGYPVMMLACPGLRVALMTTHLPLQRVAGAIDGELIRKVMRILYRELRERFGIASPEILVCGLNPHAGEGGHLGAEEQQIIAPALEELRAEGIASHGPLPADTLFTPRYLEHADAVVAMYHDQGLPVLKHMGFGRAVNITLGLPLVRTSVDHGTALDLAGTGRAESGSLVAAIEAARSMTGETSSMTEHDCAYAVPG